MSFGQRQRISLLRHDFLTLSSPFRTIVGCTPRNTKPPIREPNMPEKQEKKDKEKEKKQKKPVIRMKGGLTDGSEKDVKTEAESSLRDNMDVNFKCQWGIRIPEEVGTAYAESSQKWSADMQQTRDASYFVGDTNYSNYQPTCGYSMDAMETMKGMKFSMSSADDKGNTKAKTEEQKPEQATTSSGVKENKDADEFIKNILRTPSVVMKETSATSEDYNVPINTNFDAEITAWKELVQKSKVPIDAAKEFNAQMSSDAPRTAEMLTIRPEPPRPKLDIRAVRSMDELIKEEEEDEVPSDVKAKPVELKRDATSADIQKVDSKKMHTAAPCYLKRNSDSGYDFKRKYRFPSHSWRMESDDHVHDPKYVAADFSTSTEGGYENVQQNVAKGAGGVRPDEPEANSTRSQDIERSNVPMESLAPQDIQPEQIVDSEFGDSLHPIAEREIEMSLSQPTQENQEMRERQVASKKYEVEQEMRDQSDDFQGNFEYTSPYEDDFYPGYESMSLEPIAERPNLEKQPQQASVRDEEQDDREMYAKNAKEAENISEYVTEGNYVRVPGDPYPYSKEHFQKWRLHHEDIRIGPISCLDKEPLINTPIADSSTSQSVDVQQPAPESYVPRNPGNPSNPTNSDSNPSNSLDPWVTPNPKNPSNLMNPSSSSNPSNPSKLSNPSGSPKPSRRSNPSEPPKSYYSSNPGSMPPPIDFNAGDIEDKLGIEDLKKHKDPVHVETIQPNLNYPMQGGGNPAISKRQIKSSTGDNSSLVEDPETVNLIKGEKDIDDTRIHTMRNQELLSVEGQVIREIYEAKNYAYLRPEEMKNLRLVSRPRPPTTESNTTTTPVEQS
ncbi:actin cytoskeleton-regulatory complex protein PAN1-like [Ceratina calcarata]|uniref:Actin cytoskeleton-regulatory complex protein PAN1-like n=1 Tax=Ceratina calcarata TaxID=156304 RepID=A0AAJ7SAD8_9HYME|nr:actin cytoskeleton-regulatory complex protein PAN1-like [Ceratina calcarata]